MDWLKNVVVDILVTLFIAAALLIGDMWMWWIILVYTLLLLVAKGVTASSSGTIAQKARSTDAPIWFYHLLYGLNIIMLGLTSWWFLTVGWVAIWLLSYLSLRNDHS